MKTTHSAGNLILTVAAVVCAAVALLIAVPAAAADSRPGGSLADLTRVPATDWGLDLTVSGPLLAQTDLDLDRSADVYDFEEKSPRRAFLQSFLIPGWGQYYVRAGWWKPVVFFGLEVASWYGVSHFHSSGNDLEDEYQAFADTHWDRDKYLQGLYEVYYTNNQLAEPDDPYLDTIIYRYTLDIPGEPDDSLVEQRWSHHAFYHVDGSEVDDYERYENVGKYHQFTFGWDDYPAVGDAEFPDGPRDSTKIRVVSPNRNTYLHMRDEANTEYKRASKMLVVVAVNHLVSGIEAALGARRYNRSRDEFGTVETNIRLVLSPTTGQPMPHVTVGYRF